MTRHYRFKFGCEIFLNIQGYPMTLDPFPSTVVVDAWRVLYLLDGIWLDDWYILHMQKRSEEWKTVGNLPFHLEYLEEERRGK